MSDIVERLRDSVRACRALDRSALLAEAADEIERLRLTDVEREAVEICEGACRNMAQNGVAGEAEIAATLRGMLERLE